MSTRFCYHNYYRNNKIFSYHIFLFCTNKNNKKRGFLLSPFYIYALILSYFLNMPRGFPTGSTTLPKFLFNTPAAAP